jgi:hypothetical protein
MAGLGKYKRGDTFITELIFTKIILNINYKKKMSSIKSDKIFVSPGFQFEIYDGWFIEIENESSPVKYTLMHGKKSVSFHSDVMKDLIKRNYSIRLAKGRKQMIVPPQVLQAFVDHEIFFSWYDNTIE